VKIGLVLLLAVTVLYGVLFMVLRPAVNNDAGIGFTILESARRGAPFNTVFSPDPLDLTRDVSSFVAAWSPSQYQLPALFQIGGLDLGQATAAATAMCVCIGLLGWFSLYRALGFSPTTSFLTCGLLVAFRHTLEPLAEYNGGETVMFAAAPWCGVLIWGARDAGAVRAFVATLVALVFATYAKLSGVIFIAALVAGVAAFRWRLRISAGVPGRPWGMPLMLAMRDMIPMALALNAFVALFQLFWISRGWTALTTKVAQPFEAGRISFPFVSTVVSAFDLQDALDFSYSLPVIGDLFANTLLLYALLAPPCAYALFIVVRGLWARLGDAVLFVLAACGTYAAAFVALYLLDAEIYHNDRFFRPTSLMLLPFLIAALFTAPSMLTRAAFGAFVAVACIYGVMASAWHAAVVDRSPVGRMGLRQPSGTPELMAWFQANYDRPDPARPDRIVLLGVLEQAMEIANARVIIRNIEDDPLDVLNRLSYRGRVSEVAVLLPVSTLPDGRAETLLKAFKDYPPDRWERRAIGARYVEFRQ
jgi:hypothetical protein